jgi:2'-5' RNA ligase
MRCFFALWPVSALQHALSHWGVLCQRVSGGRSVPAERLHLTLAFLGEVEPDRYRLLLTAADAVRCAAFDLCLDRVAYWRNSRVVFATADAVPPVLSDLAARLGEQLAKAGFPIERREFVPHVTLIRDARRAPVGVEVAPLVWSADALALVETLRGERKLSYRILQRWTFVD